jgi:hypothetical protein
MHPSITPFLTAIKARLDRAGFWRIFAGLLSIHGLILAAVCLFWVMRGYAVPQITFFIALALVPVLGLIAWVAGRVSLRQAATQADEHFGLKDALRSHLGLQEQRPETTDFLSLQAQATADRIATLQPAQLPIAWSRRWLGVASALFIACFGMSFIRTSPVILEKQAQEDSTTRKTAEINEELEKEIAALTRDATPEEKALLDTPELRQWLKELRQTKDTNQALRQYAKLEQRLAEAAQKMTPKAEEQLLAKAAEELEQEAPLRPIAKPLAQKDYRQASSELQQLRLEADATAKPDAARQELAKLKAAAQRMAAAARQHQQRSGQTGAPGQQGQSSSSQSLDDQMLALEQQVNQVEKQRQQDPNSSECKSCQNKANQQLQKLSQSLNRSAAQRDVAKKLQSLCQCAGQCQSYLCDKECKSLGECNKPGSGQKPGSGSTESRRAESELTQDTGRRDQIQGQKGSGPSTTTTESADSGTGTATQTTAAPERPWQRQVESFIQREDVPPDLKSGVKEYFKAVQGVRTEAPAATKPAQ